MAVQTGAQRFCNRPRRPHDGRPTGELTGHPSHFHEPARRGSAGPIGDVDQQAANCRQQFAAFACRLDR